MTTKYYTGETPQVGDQVAHGRTCRLSGTSCYADLAMVQSVDSLGRITIFVSKKKTKGIVYPESSTLHGEPACEYALVARASERAPMIGERCTRKGFSTIRVLRAIHDGFAWYEFENKGVPGRFGWCPLSELKPYSDPIPESVVSLKLKHSTAEVLSTNKFDLSTVQVKEIEDAARDSLDEPIKEAELGCWVTVEMREADYNNLRELAAELKKKKRVDLIPRWQSWRESALKVFQP